MKLTFPNLSPINALVWIDWPREKIIKHIKSIYEKLKNYDLKLIYFHGNSVREEVDRALNSRRKEWIDKNITEFVKNPFGHNYRSDPIQGLHSFFASVVEVYENTIELLPINKLLVNKADLNWPRIENEVIDFIEKSS